MVQKFESAEEIENLDGFQAKVRKGEQEFAEFVGWYIFKDKRHCARADCNKPHNFGYVVRTSLGKVVAIGNVCGSNVFGHLFTSSKRIVDLQIARARAISGVSITLAESEHLLARIDELMSGPYGVEWFERARKSLAQACPPQVWSRFHTHISGGDPWLKVFRRRDKDKDGPDLGMKRSDLIEERVGYIQGMRAFLNVAPREMLEARVKKDLLVFRQLTPTHIVDNKPVKKRFSDWEKGVVDALRSAESTLTEARSFFTAENLAQLTFFARGSAEYEAVKRLRWNSDAGVVEVESRVA